MLVPPHLQASLGPCWSPSLPEILLFFDWPGLWMAHIPGSSFGQEGRQWAFARRVSSRPSPDLCLWDTSLCQETEL